ncbi:helix-turn-helix domain-containing protein [Streptomyces sp. NPDC005917]|uniref:helix-turn-helix domain-containing protein n=1 Tax=unclassified Streptomyces TaxID=2593676 RepID=UPI0034078B60
MLRQSQTTRPGLGSRRSALGPSRSCRGSAPSIATAVRHDHRSTLRYRLQRIRAISDRNLADVNTRLKRRTRA